MRDTTSLIDTSFITLSLLPISSLSNSIRCSRFQTTPPNTWSHILRKSTQTPISLYLFSPREKRGARKTAMEAAHLPDTDPSKLYYGRYLVRNDIDQMPDTSRRGSHRRDQSENFFRLPSDDEILFDADADFSLPDIQLLPQDTDSASFPVPIDSAAKLGESNGGDASKGRVSGNNSTHFRSLFVDAASSESLGLQPLGNDGQREKPGGGGGGRGVQERVVHRHSNSMDGSTSSFESDTLSTDYSKKAMAPDKVAELALIDPKRAKRFGR